MCTNNFFAIFFFIQIQLDYFSAYHDQSIPTNKIFLLSCYLLVDLLNKVWWGEGDPASPLCFHENPAFRTTVDVRRSKKLLLKLPIGDRTKRIKQETPRGVALHYNQNKFEWIPLTGKQSNPVYPVNVSRIPDCILVKSRILGIPFPNRYENYPLRQALSNFEREIYRLDLGVSL